MMEEIAKSLMEKNIKEQSDYVKKYEELLATTESNIEPSSEVVEKKNQSILYFQ